MLKAYNFTDVRKAILNYFEAKGAPLTRTGSGNAQAYDMADGKRVLLKSGAKGNIMATALGTRSQDEIRGLENNIADYVMAAAILPHTDIIHLYVVPIAEFTRQLKDTHALWEGTHNPSNNRKCTFKDLKGVDPWKSYVGEIWAKYKVDEISLVNPMVPDTPYKHETFIDQIKKQIADHYLITPDQVKISIEM